MDNTGSAQTQIIRTAQFGEINVEPHHIFIFENGLLGFEDLRRFILISEEETEPFKWLISLDMPEIGFPLLSPFHIDFDYDLGKDIDFERFVVFVIITLEDENGKMTANLKAPVILDAELQKGEQIILPKDKYLPDFVLPVSNSVNSESVES